MAGLPLAFCAMPQNEAASKPASIEYATIQVVLPDDSSAVIAEKAAKVLPRPNQSAWMRLERTFFLHFGMNTFRGVEWGDGREDPSIFNPTSLDAKQWVSAMKNAGCTMLILVSKHHDGFCMWPTRYTSHSVVASPWLNGKGDLVRAVADAARTQGIKLGIYLSPADLYQLRTNPKNPTGYYGNNSRRVPSAIPTDPASFLKDPTQGRTLPPGSPSLAYSVDDYNRYFLNQLYELLTEYGPIADVWFDGANPDPSVPQTYDYAAWYDLIRRLQPGAVISVKGPDVRWVGNEGGYGRTTEWSVIPLSESPEKHAWPDKQNEDLGSRAKLKPGSHLWWYPAEVNTPILNGWFWSAEKRAKSPAELVDYYYRSVGRNGVMLLNLSPDTRGLIPDDQLASLGRMSQVVNDTFARDLAAGSTFAADTFDSAHSPALAHDDDLDTWWEAAPGQTTGSFTLTLPKAVTFDVVSLQEAVAQRSQRIESFVIETWNGSTWTAPTAVEEQTTVGHKRLVRLSVPITTDQVRIRITGSRFTPTLAEIGLFKQSLPKEPVVSDRSRDGFVTLTHPHQLPIVYTIDGTEPTANSPVYKSQLTLPRGGTVHAAVLTSEGRLGLTAIKTFVGLAPTGWKVVGDGANNPPEFAAVNAIDANAATLWKAQASQNQQTNPSLTIDMGSCQPIGGFVYLPRQDWVFQGVVDRYRFETSLDGTKWTTQVDAGVFGNIRNNPMLQEVRFAPVEARYFRFTALHDVDDNGWVGAAEISVLPAAKTLRTTQSLDNNWRFHVGDVPDAETPGYDDSAWQTVDVPHDYVVEGTFDQKPRFEYPGMRLDWHWLHGFLSVQSAVYRKALEIPTDAKGKRLWLEFDGVFSNSHYWLNGKVIGSQYSGYSRSCFDITDAAKFGDKNQLVVRVDPRFDGWWYEGGGIYRHVRLVTVGPIHIAPDGVFVAPKLADPGDGTNADAVVVANTNVTNTGAVTASATVLSEILNAKGEVLATASSCQKLSASTGLTIVHELKLPHANLWSPTTPYLYKMRNTVSVAGKTVDRVTTDFGVRHGRFDAEHGFFLNGKHIKLQGVNMHQDHAGVGVAVPDRLFTWRLERLKEVGCNAIRMSHNPVAPFLLDECDRLGFLVIAENRHLGDTYADQAPKDTPAIELRDLSEMIVRDRNHPSIILWSLCNEQWIQGSPEAAAIAHAMKIRVVELDPTRPVTAAMNGGFDSPKGMASALDVIGINYNPSVYDNVHALFPKSPIVASEIASEISTRGIYTTNRWDDYYGDRERGHISAYSITAGPAGQTVEQAWPPVAAKDFVAGGFVWAAFDYKGEPRPFAWPVINCHYGFMDICGFPKDSYYYYKSWWTHEPVLHLFPHWNWFGKEGQEISVWVHSNCQDVELFLNGATQGKRSTKPNHHLEWKVRYAPGKLTAKGLYKGRVIEAVQETTGEPVAIRLTPDRTELIANNADLAVVKVEVIDALGRVVPTANNKITFKLSGPAKLIGVGNGDPSCHEPDKADSRSAFNGLAQVIVQTIETGGEIRLVAESPDLKSTSISLQSH